MFQSPRGTFDIFGEEQKYWEWVEESFKTVVSSFGFEKIQTPIFEFKNIYERTVGPYTEIVGKQMYALKRKGDSEEDESEMVLRPELTAGIARAYIQHGMHTLPSPRMLYSIGPVFRYEKPQKGRFRQHHQLDLEVIGAASPFADAFLISIFWVFLKRIGLKNFIVAVNNLGCRGCRNKIKKAILDYLTPYKSLLCENCKERFLLNPLRIFDCKENKCREIVAQAPSLIDFVCQECREHFKNVLEYLDELGLAYDFDSHLVRGLDYYTKTVFEIKTSQSDLALGGGGRYDYLIESLGGRATPAIGGAIGIERLISEVKGQSINIIEEKRPTLFLIKLGELAKKRSLPLIRKLWEEGFRILIDLEKDSLKSQLRSADKAKANYALILGQKEAQDGTIIVRNMLGGTQETIRINKLSEYLKKRMGGVVYLKKED